MLTFVNENFCVDGPLAYAFRASEDYLITSTRLQKGALACIIIAFCIQMFTFLFLTDMFYIWTFHSTFKDLVVPETQN
jgi:hypothetical protein